MLVKCCTKDELNVQNLEQQGSDTSATKDVSRAVMRMSLTGEMMMSRIFRIISVIETKPGEKRGRQEHN